ncbi:MAG TPA: RnfABCDGE type electron transport complex subunit G [Candidatus Hydrogenedentes bacterium]|nr:RnfABCDGE type electron transport complex subunit G [Candidatus Hydrogenedentota bacterium]
MSKAGTIVAPKADMPSSIVMIRTLGGMAMISGVLLALVYQGTYGIIQRNKEEAVRQAVFAVIPAAVEQTAFEITEAGGVEHVTGEPTGRPQLFVGHSENGKLLGVAIEASGQGYGGLIRVLYGYNPAEEVITGLKVLESKETPGLGDKITKEPFLSNFGALDVTLDAEKENPVNPIAFVKHGEKTQPWQVDGISGATISSKAVTKMLRESTTEMLPFVHAHLSELEEAAP